ncbi:tRNA dihydrouridine synthase [Desulfobotulus mexicanus]|nr:tRNA-dihydrouridine synthase family protein [Desulfobotulus mexicanus]
MIIMAPMRGYTDRVFREVWSRNFSGVDEAVAPFISLQQAKDLSVKILGDLAKKETGSIPVVPQILGNHPAAFISLACRLEDMGFRELNWNLGCPFPMVAKKAKGSGLLCFPDRVDAFLEEVCSHSPLKVSVKIRLGRHSKDETGALLAVLNRYPLHRVILHPRIGVQMYEGRPDLKAFHYFLHASCHPLVYNGDIWSRDDFQALSSCFSGVNSWMLGRGLLADPFLPERIKGIFADKKEDELDRFILFYKDLEAAYQKKLSGPSHLLARMKGWWVCFNESFEGGDILFKKIRKLQKLDLFQKEVQAFFDSRPAWLPSRAGGWVDPACCIDHGRVEGCL